MGGDGGCRANPSTVNATPHFVDTSPLFASDTLNSCQSLWTASTRWWQARRVTSQLHSPAGGGTVGGDWLYGL